MKIINNTSDDFVKKSDIEHVENEKQEYKLVGRFRRTPGLKLFSYNSSSDELKELVHEKETLLKLNDDGTSSDFSSQKANIDSRNIQFESLNMKNAIKRVDKYKSGKIKSLSNLKQVKENKLF